MPYRVLTLYKNPFLVLAKQTRKKLYFWEACQHRTNLELEMKTLVIGALVAIYCSAALQAEAASCTPVDQRGQACIALIKNEKGPDPGGTKYELTFENRCNKIISVVAETRNIGQDGDNESSTGVSPGRTATIVCVDRPQQGRGCGGFTSWYPNCH